MKVLLSLFSLVALSTALGQREDVWCRCALMVDSDPMLYMVYDLGEAFIEACSEHDRCKNRCYDKIRAATNEMDLWSHDDSGFTIGSNICQYLFSSYNVDQFNNKYVHGYYQVCGGPWEYTFQDSQQMLCCNMGIHEHCITRN
ncbi:uncharacterized protein [Penaeus vannamei]|uniref:uncharacterized protein n=1 Tax=Penaeus vannamei TaxID=6689 RepID=UPI00387F3CB2